VPTLLHGIEAWTPEKRDINATQVAELKLFNPAEGCTRPDRMKSETSDWITDIYSVKNYRLQNMTVMGWSSGRNIGMWIPNQAFQYKLWVILDDWRTMDRRKLKQTIGLARRTVSLFVRGSGVRPTETGCHSSLYCSVHRVRAMLCFHLIILDCLTTFFQVRRLHSVEWFIYLPVCIYLWFI
jgi:hypothetical protein